MELRRLSDMFPNRPEAVRTHIDGFQPKRILQVPHHVLTVFDRFDRLQRVIEERRKIVFLFPDRDRSEDLVEIEITKAGRRFGRFCFLSVVRRQGQHASKRRPRIACRGRAIVATLLRWKGWVIASLSRGAIRKQVLAQ